MNPETAEVEKEEPEEVVTRVADPWYVVQESRQTVNPFAKSEKPVVVAAASSVAAAKGSAVVSPMAISSSVDPRPEVATTTTSPAATIATPASTMTTPAATIATPTSTMTTPATTATTPAPSSPIHSSSLKRSTTPETEQTDEITVAVVTGEPDAKKQKVEEEIVRLRRMSEDYAESERKRSVELLNVGAMNGEGQQDSDGFAFSEDDDDFDVPDIRIYSVLFSNSSENSTSFGIDFPTKNLYL